MNISGGVALGISQPIASNPLFGWQGALAFSIILTLITMIVWIPMLRGEKVDLSIVNNNKYK